VASVAAPMPHSSMDVANAIFAIRLMTRVP
jgi:hypothetical protein